MSVPTPVTMGTFPRHAEFCAAFLPDPEHDDCALSCNCGLDEMRHDLKAAVEDRNRWIQLFNRLEKHVSRHHDTKTAVGFTDDADDVLHRGWRQVMKDAGSE